MIIQGVRKTLAKGMTAAVLAGAVLVLAPVQAPAQQLSIAAQFGDRGGYGYDDGRNAYWQREHYEHERAEAIARHEAWERQQAYAQQEAWERQQAYLRQQEFYRQQAWARQHEAWEHEAREHGYDHRGYDRHDGYREREHDGDRWR